MKFMLNPPKGRLGVLIYRRDGEPECHAEFLAGRFDTDTLPEEHQQRAIDLFQKQPETFWEDDENTTACPWPNCDFLGTPKAVLMHSQKHKKAEQATRQVKILAARGTENTAPIEVG